MNKYLIRFNKSRGQPGRGSIDHVWRVFENGQEYLVKGLDIKVPSRSEQTAGDWNVSCVGFMEIDKNETAIITAEKMSSPEILQFKDILSKPEWDYVVNKTLYGKSWSFGGYSNNPSNINFWKMDLNDDPFFSNHMAQQIQSLTQTKMSLIRVYANGQTYGTPGALHQDQAEDGYRTFLYYPGPVWDIEWGGFTVFSKPNFHATICPTPNSAVFFKSDLWHYGSEPNRNCKQLRVTVAFKMKIVE